jgi:hypothetical protein
MAKPKVHKPGVKIYDSVVAQLPDLLKELLAAPAAKVSEHPPIHEAPGIYLFSEPGGAGGGADKAIYVGQTRKLRSRLKNHTRLGGKNNQATFAFLLAKTDAEAAGVDTKQYREVLEQDEDFIAHFDGAKSRVAEMQVRFILLDGLLCLGTSETDVPRHRRQVKPLRSVDSRGWDRG